jgi:repressor LexA
MSDHRPTKKQRELLSFIDSFIKGNGYGPSYREVMRALDYRSVSTVATHVDGLIARGYLRKTDNSARSLQVVTTAAEVTVSDHVPHLDWLRQEITIRRQVETPEKQGEADLLESAYKLLDPTPNKQV